MYRIFSVILKGYNNQPSAAGHQFIEDLGEFAPRWLPEIEEVQMAVHYKDSNGKDRVKGGKDLKNSQSYPLPFFPQLFNPSWVPTSL